MDCWQSKIVTQASTRNCPAHVLTFGGCPLCEAPRHSCSSLLFLITLFHFLPALSLCLLLVPQAAGSASLPFVTPAGTSGEDKILWPYHWENSKGMSGKGKSHNAINRWGEKPQIQQRTTSSFFKISSLYLDGLPNMVKVYKIETLFVLFCLSKSPLLSQCCLTYTSCLIFICSLGHKGNNFRLGGGISRCSHARWEMWFLQHIQGLIQALLVECARNTSPGRRPKGILTRHLNHDLQL